jgi:hypothetical protein
MGSKNSRNFNQDAIEMLKNGNLNNFDLNRLLTPALHFQQAQNTYQATVPQNAPLSCAPIFYPSKQPRQGAENIIMTGSLASTRLPPQQLINNETTKYNSKSNSNLNQIDALQFRNKYDTSSVNRNMFESNSNGGKIMTSKKESSPTPNKCSLLQELLECPICMNLYDNPYVLPCQHTFCKKCIISLQNSDSNRNNLTTIDCPICREKHTLANGIDSLTANYTMKRLIELDAIAATEKEKLKEKEKEREKERELEKEKLKEKSKAKCFSCQKFSFLKVCDDCSYMLCYECIENPNHELIIGNYFFVKFILKRIVGLTPK